MEKIKYEQFSVAFPSQANIEAILISNCHGTC
jgi:hypothetical protein